MRRSIKFYVNRALLRNRANNQLVPVKQDYILLEVNNQRLDDGLHDINMNQLASCLGRMKGRGLVSKVRWYTPSSMNMWSLTNNQEG